MRNWGVTGGAARRRQPAFVDGSANPQEGALIHVEIGVDWVERNDGGEQCLILVDQVAQGQEVPADLPIDGGRDPRVLQVKPINLQVRLGSIELGQRLFLGRLVLVELLLANALFLGQVPGPGKVLPGELELSVVGGHLRFPQAHLGFVGLRIDLEEQLSRLHFRSFLEGHPDQVTGDPGDDVHRLDGIGAPGEVHVIGHLALDGATDRYCSRLRRSGLRLARLASE